MNNQKTLIALIIVLVGLITFLGGYLVAQKKNTLQSANISSNLNRFSDIKVRPLGDPSFVKTSVGRQGQTLNEPTLRRLSMVKALNPYLSEDGKKIIYAEKGTAKIFAVDFSGQDNLYQGPPLPSLANPNISGVVLSKNRQKIAYLYFDKNADEGQISLANPDGSIFKNILATRARQLKLDWVNDQQISFHNPAGEDYSLFLLNIENKQLEKILGSSRGLKILWSPDGSKLLYSSENRLSLLDLKNKSALAIDLSTEADRCVWTLNSLFIYCGSTPSINSGQAGSPQTDFKQTSDSLYQLDVVKKEFGLVFQPSSVDKIKIKKPLLSPAEDHLFFVNDFDGYLYRINLN